MRVKLSASLLYSLYFAPGTHLCHFRSLGAKSIQLIKEDDARRGISSPLEDLPHGTLTLTNILEGGEERLLIIVKTTLVVGGIITEVRKSAHVCREPGSWYHSGAVCDDYSPCHIWKPALAEAL